MKYIPKSIAIGGLGQSSLPQELVLGFECSGDCLQRLHIHSSHHCGEGKEVGGMRDK